MWIKDPSGPTRSQRHIAASIENEYGDIIGMCGYANNQSAGIQRLRRIRTTGVPFGYLEGECYSVSCSQQDRQVNSIIITIITLLVLLRLLALGSTTQRSCTEHIPWVVFSAIRSLQEEPCGRPQNLWNFQSIENQYSHCSKKPNAYKLEQNTQFFKAMLFSLWLNPPILFLLMWNSS